MSKNLIKALEREGLEFKIVNMGEDKQGIMIDTDYYGPYPTTETLKKQTTIMSIVRRYKALKVESRGFYTGMLITSK